MRLLFEYSSKSYNWPKHYYKIDINTVDNLILYAILLSDKKRKISEARRNRNL